MTTTTAALTRPRTRTALLRAAKPTVVAVAMVRATGSRFIPATQAECRQLVHRFLRAKERQHGG